METNCLLWWCILPSHFAWMFYCVIRGAKNKSFFAFIALWLNLWNELRKPQIRKHTHTHAAINRLKLNVQIRLKPQIMRSFPANVLFASGRQISFEERAGNAHFSEYYILLWILVRPGRSPFCSLNVPRGIVCSTVGTKCVIYIMPRSK